MLSRPVTTPVCTSLRFLAAGLLAATLAVRGLGAGPSTELDIPVFTGGYGIKFYEETARQFEALRPDVKIKIYGDPRNVDKVRIRVINGNFPDATLTRDLLVPALVHAGKVRDLRPFLAGPNWEGDGSWGDSFVPGALETWRVEGGIYGVPFTYSCWTIFYDKKFFREHGLAVPRTWDEFLALCEKIRATGRAPLSWPGVYGHYPDAFFRAAYYNLAGADGWRALNALEPGAHLDPRYVRSAALLQRLAQNYLVRGWEGMTHTAAQQAFLLGQSAMTVSGSWFVNEMEGKIPADFELGVMNFPVFPDGVAEPTTIQTGSDCFFVFATGDPQRERLTLEFLRFLTSRSRAEAFVRRMDSLVAVRGVPRSAYSPRMQEAAEMVAQAKESFNMPQVMLQTPTVRQASVDERFALMTGQITPQQFGERMEAAAATDRASLAEPGRVQIRHPFGGTLLLLLLGSGAAWFGWKKFRPKAAEAITGREAQLERAGFFARLRAPMALGFVGPAFLLYALIVLLPGATSFAWAFTRWDGIGARTWAGLFNFKSLLFESDLFWSALGNNLFLVVVPTLVVVPLALFFATLIHRGVWGANMFRAVLLFPNLLGGIAATLLWMSAYEPNGGLVNAGLVALGQALDIQWLRAFAGHPWLSPAHLYCALIPIYLWMACGFNLILFLAAMEGIDPQLYEAAEIDGAPAWWQFFGITLPLIWEVIVIAAVFIVISGLNAFEMIWLLSSQDPTAGTHTLGTLLVTTMFKEFQIGRATAIAVLMFGFVLAASMAVMRGLKREAVE
jgi:raffinose/stachyose/melibiose transport system permease protein